jgi:hypothetical protein
LGPQGLRERVDGVTLLPELAELGTHPVEGAILVAGCHQQIKTSKHRAARNKHENDEIEENWQQHLTWKTCHAGPL